MKTPSPRFPADPATVEQAALWAARLDGGTLDAADRTACGPVAPPDGLYLLRVGYSSAEK